MAAKKQTSLKEKTLEELSQLAEEKALEITKLKTELVSGQKKNTRSVKSARKELARVKTLLREKVLEQKSEEKEK